MSHVFPKSYKVSASSPKSPLFGGTKSADIPRSDLRDPDSRAAAGKSAHGELYQPCRSVPSDATAQFGNLSLAVRVVGNLKRLADLQRGQFLGVCAPLGWFSERLPLTVDHVLIADAERITAERIDSVAVFVLDSSLSKELKPCPSSQRGVRCLDATFVCHHLHGRH